MKQYRKLIVRGEWIGVTDGGATIPRDERNRDWRRVLREVETGEAEIVE
jgi:hypothetical protein